MTQTLEQWLARYEAGQVDRRTFLQGVAALAASVAGAGAAGAQPTPAGLVGVAGTGVHHLEIKTVDLARSAAFYGRLLRARPETRPGRVVLPIGRGAALTQLSIGVGPIPRVDHFSVKVPGMHPTNPDATLRKLTAEGFEARLTGHSVYVMDPDGFEVQIQAPSTTA